MCLYMKDYFIKRSNTKTHGTLQYTKVSFHTYDYNSTTFFKFGFTTCKAEQPLRGMEIQEKEAKNIKACEKSV